MRKGKREYIILSPQPPCHKKGKKNKEKRKAWKGRGVKISPSAINAE